MVTEIHEKQKGVLTQSSVQCFNDMVDQDECSFVSLRDVERAMLVFTYFFDKMHLLRDAINEKQRANEAPTEVMLVDTDDDVSSGISA